MGILGTQVGKFLNNTRNPNIIINVLQSNVSSLYTNLIDYRIFVPDVTEVFNELITTYDVVPLNLDKTLTTRTVIDGKPMVTGFSDYKIRNIMHSNPVYLLDLLSGIYLDYYYYLKKVQDMCYKSLYSFEEFQILFNNVYELYQVKPFNKWINTQTVFQYIYERENFKDTSNCNSIILLSSSFFIYEVFIRSTDFSLQLCDYLKLNNPLEYSDFQTSFATYIGDNQLDIAEELTQYMLDNVFSITDYDTEFSSTIEDEVYDLLEVLPESFNNTFTEAFVDSIIIQDVYFGNLTTFFMFGYCSLESTISHFYPNRNTYWNIDSRLDTKDTEFLNSLKEKLTNNIHNLKNIEYVALQFKDDPLYLINSYVYTHAKWVGDMLDDSAMWILPTFDSLSNYGIYNISGGAYTWTRSSVGSDMFYLKFDGIVDVDEPVYICEGAAILFKTTDIELTLGEWTYTNLDNLDNDTIYIRLGAGAVNPNPDFCDVGYLKVSSSTTLQEILYMMPLIGLRTDAEPQGADLIIDYLKVYDFSQSLTDSNAAKLSCYLIFQKMMDVFLESDNFKSYIMDYFLIGVYNKIKEKLPLQFNIAQHVDKVIIFIKTMFINDMINNDKLFTNLITSYTTACQYVLTNNTSVTITNDVIKNIALYEYEFILQYTNVFNSVYLSGITAEYLTNLLDKYRIDLS